MRVRARVVIALANFLPQCPPSPPLPYLYAPCCVCPIPCVCMMYSNLGGVKIATVCGTYVFVLARRGGLGIIRRPVLDGLWWCVAWQVGMIMAAYPAVNLATSPLVGWIMNR